MSERPCRDSGMTLPEVLIAMVVLSMVGAVIASLSQVALVANESSQGRVAVAGSEQALGSVLPQDLASAASVDVDPAAVACASNCTPTPTGGGSNALALSWTTGRSADGSATGWVRVSYVIAPTTGSTPPAFELRRVMCRSSDNASWSCEERVILRDLDGPPAGQTFVPGVTVPTWALQVSAPLAAAATSSDELAPASELKDARRVVVTVNGGGRRAGAGGGVNQITITAGGTARGELAPSDLSNAASFSIARSRCGGPITLIVDESGSIGSAMPTVRAGVQAFVETFRGTPTQLQVVAFESVSSVLGAGSAWSRYFDLSDDGAADELIANVASLTASGGTNWEDAWFRAVYEPDGGLQPTVPEMVVFFTDGKPTYERLRLRASPGQIIADAPPAPGPGWPTLSGGYYSNGYSYTQVGFNRADWIVDQLRSSARIIGVGVGGITTGSSEWVDSPGAGYHYFYERGYRMYQRFSSGTWQWIDEATYLAGNTTPDSTDNFRAVTKEYVNKDSDAQDWEPTTTESDGGGYRATKVYAEPYDAYDPVVTELTSDKVILSRLISGGDFAVEGHWNEAEQRYDNAATAELYSLDNIDKFAQALRAVALAECGGTLSVSTRLPNGTRAPSEFSFQNSTVTSLDGSPLTVEPTVVRVNATFPVGTFDFNVPGAATVLVDVVPTSLSQLTGYAPQSDNPWVCKAGSAVRSYTPVPIDGSSWVGARVAVGANEAVSCVLQVVTT